MNRPAVAIIAAALGALAGAQGAHLQDRHDAAIRATVAMPAECAAPATTCTIVPDDDLPGAYAVEVSAR